MSDITPEQAAELLEQAESSLENGEFNPDNFDFSNGNAGEADNSTETAQTTPDNPQDSQETPSEQTPPKELDYVQLLAQERAERLALEQRLAQLQTQETPQAQDNLPQDEPVGEIDPDELFGEFDGKGLINGINHIVNQRVEKLVEQQLAQRLASIEQKHAQDLQAEHLNAIHAVHPDAETVVNSDEFAKWVQSQPSYIQPSIVAVVENGNASQINELLTNYKATLTPPPKTDDVQAKANDIIKNTTPDVPNSLSEMGGQTATDPMQAVANMNAVQMADTMSSWTPEQIENFLNRQI